MGSVSCSEEKGGRPQPICGDLSRNLLEKYSQGKLLGQGAFGAVYGFTNRRTGEEVAVKLVDKRETPMDASRREAEIMQAISHRNVVAFREAFWDGGYACLVMDGYAGDFLHSLLPRLRDQGRIPCHRAVHLCAQAAAAVEYLHRQCIIHRDVKAENFLVDRADFIDPDCRVALADFDVALRLENPAARLQADLTGTKVYWAPERFGCGTYGLKADVWALGVALYTLFAGRFPFKDEQTSSRRAFKPHLSQRLDEDCRDLLARMLEKDEEGRLGADEVATHRWLNSWAPACTSISGSTVPESDEVTAPPLPEEFLMKPAQCMKGGGVGVDLSNDRGDVGSASTASLVDIAITEEEEEDVDDEIFWNIGEGSPLSWCP